MDFVDRRKSSNPGKVPNKDEKLRQAAERARRKLRDTYVDEVIREAQERGEFSNLPGMGKPVNLDEHFAAGDKSLAYGLLRSNGYSPPEIEMAKEIDARKKRAEAKLAPLIHRGKTLRTRRVPPFEREKQAYNAAVEKAAAEYERELRGINSRILSLNISAPAALHRPLLRVEELVQQFHIACPLFTE